MGVLTVKLQGVEVQANLLNPEVAKNFECGFNKVLREFDEAKKIEMGSDGIAYQCQSVINYVEDIFGHGSAKKVFGEQTDLIACLDVLEEMLDLYETQVVPIINEKKNHIKEKMKAVCDG